MKPSGWSPQSNGVVPYQQWQQRCKRGTEKIQMHCMTLTAVWIALWIGRTVLHRCLMRCTQHTRNHLKIYLWPCNERKTALSHGVFTVYKNKIIGSTLYSLRCTIIMQADVKSLRFLKCFFFLCVFSEFPVMAGRFPVHAAVSFCSLCPPHNESGHPVSPGAGRSHR